VIADELGFAKRAVELLELAAKLHDIGKIGVPDSVLLKEGKLEAAEFELIKRHCGFGNSIINPTSEGDVQAYQRHTQIGATLLEVDGYPVMELAAVIAQTHHEKWDGSGYPLGLQGDSIPIVGRITAVADVFDALSSKRPYKPAFPHEKCFGILEEGRGTHFDPRILDAFFARSDEIVTTQIRYAEH
jgi:putative two-component system response regulator